MRYDVILAIVAIFGLAVGVLLTRPAFPRAGEPVTGSIETLCDHGHRLYISERSYATTLVVVPGGCL